MQQSDTFPASLKIVVILAILIIVTGIFAIFSCTSEPTIAQFSAGAKAQQTPKITAQQKELLRFLSAQQKNAHPRKQKTPRRFPSSQKEKDGFLGGLPPKKPAAELPRETRSASPPASAYANLPPALIALLPPENPPRTFGDFRLGMPKAEAVKLFLNWFREGKIKPTIWSDSVMDVTWALTIGSMAGMTAAGRPFPVPYRGVSSIACQFSDSSWLPNDPKEAEKIVKEARGVAQRDLYLCELCVRLEPVANLRAAGEIPRYFTERICQRNPDLVKSKSSRQAMEETVWIGDYFAEWAHVPDDSVRRRYIWHWPSHRTNLELTVHSSPQRGKVYCEIYLWQKEVRRPSASRATSDAISKKRQ